MNILEEYRKRKQALKDVQDLVMRFLRQYDIYSIETFMVLDTIIKNPGEPQRKIAALTELSINTISTIVLSLVEKGYVTNEKDPNDTSERVLKRKLIKPTDKGLEVYNALEKLFTE